MPHTSREPRTGRRKKLILVKVEALPPPPRFLMMPFPTRPFVSSPPDSRLRMPKLWVADHPTF